MDLNTLYTILVGVARRGGQIAYSQLSREYQAATGEWHEPFGSWDNPLGELNQRLAALGWPPLSAVVVLEMLFEPGMGFWGSSPNVPRFPANEMARMAEYSRILVDVHHAPWPDAIPA